MHKGLLVVASFVPSIVLFACSGGGDNTTTDAGSDATTDAAPGPDASDASTKDVVVADAPADVNGSDASDAATVACQSPADCEGGTTPVCCGTIVADGGTPPSCHIGSVSSSCASSASCATQLQFSCNATEQVRLCTTIADCAEQNDPMCCTFQDGNQMLTFCVDSTTAGFASSCN